MHRILAIDPGVTTGYAMGDLQGNLLALAVNEDRFSPYEFYLWLRNMKPNYVIYEDFDYRNVSPAGLNLTPVKLIGIIEMLGETQLGTRFIPQKPAQGHSPLYDNAALKTMGAYKRGCEHGRDATRHMMYWLLEKAGTQLYEPPLRINLVNEKAGD